MDASPSEPTWALLSNHGKVLVCVAREPTMRVADIADCVGIKERAVQRILADLREHGLVRSVRDGRRNRYEVDRSWRMPWAQAPVEKLLDVFER